MPDTRYRSSVTAHARHAPVPRAVFQSSALPVKDRFEAWRECALPLFESILVTPPETFHGQVESVELDHVFLGISQLSPLRFHSAGAREAGGHLLVQLYLTGGYCGHNGYREVRVESGDISLLDLSRALETRAAASRALSLIVPREQFYRYANPENLDHGRVLRRDSAMGRIFGNHLLTVWKQLQTASSDEAEGVRHLLLSSVVGAFGGAQEAQQQVMERMTLDAIRAYIAQNLAEPLNPDTLCRRFACSRAQLYRLFQPFGGVAAYIRDERLKACWRELTQGKAGTTRIVDVALAWGFTSQSHFNRLFRHAFGMTPGEAVDYGASHDGARRRESCERSRTLPALHDILRQL